MTAYTLSLLGTPTLRADGAEVHISRRKVMALLAYLAVTGRAHTRDALATLLWPEWDAGSARGALRRRLSALNQLFDGCALESDREVVRLHPDLDLTLDVALFRAWLTACDKHSHAPTEACPDCLPLLTRAADLYTDAFMAGFSLDDSAAFDEWQFFEAEALKDEVSSALVRLATQAASGGDFDAAITYARRWLAIDPLHEPAHRHLIALYAKTNQRAAALRQYEVCCRMLAEELGVAPSLRTQETYERLLRGEVPLAPTAVEAILERELRQVGPCPYRGLAAFREADAPFFFGREAFVDRLEEAVVTPPCMTAVVGASGSGKSSVVFAGLLSRLRASGAWLPVVLRPGAAPFLSLANALIAHLDADLSETGRLIEARRLADALAGGQLHLTDVLGRVATKTPGHPRIVLVIDQFEELFTLGAAPQERRRFIDLILEAVAQAGLVRIEHHKGACLLTLRADFMGHAVDYRPLADMLQVATQILGPMTRNELRAAIVKPAEIQGAAFEAGLVDRLLDDVADQPGSLPLLEFALTLLWERIDFGWLTHAAYDRIGHVEGALARYADQVYTALSDTEERLAHRIFIQLVQPGVGTEDTRRIATRDEIGDEAWPLVRYLADRRLVVTNQDGASGAETVEIVHEALIQHWDRLQHWMAEDRAFRTWQERLRVSLQTWQDTDRDEGALLRGAPLAEAEAWLAPREADLSLPEIAFIEAGLALRARRAAERAAQREQELRRVAIGLAAEAKNLMQRSDQDIAVLLALEAVEHYPYTWQAEQALADIVVGTPLLAQIPQPVQVNSPPRVSPDGTKLLTVCNDGVFAVWDLARRTHLLTVQAYRGPEANYPYAAWSPSGDRILTYSLARARPRVWDATDGSLLTECAADGERLAQWSPDGNRIMAFRGDQTISIWDAQTGELVHTLPGNEDARARFSPDGRWIATSRGEIWDPETGELRRTLAGHPGPHLAPADEPTYGWSPDSAQVGAGFGDATWVWDVQTGSQILQLPTGYRGIAELTWSPDGRQILSTGFPGDNAPAIVWDAQTGSRRHTFPYYGALGPLADPWSPDSRQLLFGDEHGVVTIWDTASGREVLRVPAHRGQAYPTWLPDGDGIVTGGIGLARIWRISTAAFTLSCQPDCPADTWESFNTAAWSPDGDRIARSFDDGSVRVWDVDSREEVTRIRREGTTIGVAVNHLAWSPDGHRLLTGAGDGGVEIWDGRTGECTLVLGGHGDVEQDPAFTLDHIVMGVAWAPDGRRALTCGRDRRAVIWDTVTGEAITVFTGQEFYWGAWSPDGTRIVLVDQMSYGGPVKIWDAVTGAVVGTLLPDDFGHGTSAVAWSRDGERIVTVSLDEEGRLWDAGTGTELGTFPAQYWSAAAQWSPDGSRFLLGGDHGVHVWDAASLQRVASYPGSPDGSTGTWSPDGTAIAIGYADGETRIYPAWQSLEELIAYAKTHCVLRELTPEERVRYGLSEAPVSGDLTPRRRPPAGIASPPTAPEAR